MTQSQLDHAVARATGESINTIRHHGFSPLFIPQVAYPDPTRVPNRGNDPSRSAKVPPTLSQFDRSA
jgi:hypothetical protein